MCCFSDMSWNSQDPDKFISVGKDGLILEHHFADAQRPIDYCTPVAVDISAYGEIGLACKFGLENNPRQVGQNPFGVPNRCCQSMSTSVWRIANAFALCKIVK